MLHQKPRHSHKFPEAEAKDLVPSKAGPGPSPSGRKSGTSHPKRVVRLQFDPADRQVHSMRTDGRSQVPILHEAVKAAGSRAKKVAGDENTFFGFQAP